MLRTTHPPANAHPLTHENSRSLFLDTPPGPRACAPVPRAPARGSPPGPSLPTPGDAPCARDATPPRRPRGTGGTTCRASSCSPPRTSPSPRTSSLRPRPRPSRRRPSCRSHTRHAPAHIHQTLPSDGPVRIRPLSHGLVGNAKLTGDRPEPDAPIEHPGGKFPEPPVIPDTQTNRHRKTSHPSDHNYHVQKTGDSSQSRGSGSRYSINNVQSGA